MDRNGRAWKQKRGESQAGAFVALYESSYIRPVLFVSSFTIGKRKQLSMNPIWKESMPVRSFEVGKSGLLKPQVIFQFFQEAAGKHATHLGVGYETLRGLGLFWVLSRVKVEISKLPAWGDEVTLTTWPKGVDRLFALRDFRLSDRDGNEIVRGTSCWLLVDAEKMRPRRIDSIPRSFPLNDKEHALQESLDKIPVPAGLDIRYERRVMTSDLDVNNHVNNTEYVRWITDCLETGDGPASSIRTLQISYLEEAKLGETMVFSLGRADNAPGTIFVEGAKLVNGAKVVQAKIEINA
jgi:acyl-ACP thioesterase